MCEYILTPTVVIGLKKERKAEKGGEIMGAKLLLYYIYGMCVPRARG